MNKKTRKTIITFYILLLLVISTIPTSMSLLQTDTNNPILTPNQQNRLIETTEVLQKNLPITLTSTADGTTTKWAVLIACSGGLSYERHERRDRNDIKALQQILQKNGWDDDHIFILEQEEATTEAILNDTFQWLTDNG
jgi:hypothetical protein